MRSFKIRRGEDCFSKGVGRLLGGYVRSSVAQKNSADDTEVIPPVRKRAFPRSFGGPGFVPAAGGRTFPAQSSSGFLALAGVIIFALSLSAGVANAASKDLQFDEKGKFKIVQFTDVHWKSDSTNHAAKILGKMASVLDIEKPDLVIFTGDVVTSRPVEKGWEKVLLPIVERKIPWAATLGNHDDEHDLKRAEIVSLLEQRPHSLVARGAVDIDGEGNFILRIKSRRDKQKDAAIIYCLDSLTYSATYLARSQEERKKHPNDRYAWIEPSQIEWYRENSKKLTKENGGTPLPSLAFFHIPLPEFNAAWDSQTPPPIGSKGEPVCCPEKNSGLFSAMVDCRDVMGVFVGHDHDNDYAGLADGICLAYGRALGLDTYGKLPKGARVIELNEGTRTFNTWIQTGDSHIHQEIKYPNSFAGKIGATVSQADEQPLPLVCAHAHNDYEHTRPLLDALDNGFCSVEADIWLVDGQLFVSHNAKDVNQERTLQALYLDPLQKRMEKNGGAIYAKGLSVTLLVDIKSDPVQTYQALAHVLKGYEKMLTRFHQDRTETNAVTVIITGRSPRQMMNEEKGRLAGFEGRLKDLGCGETPSFMPLISDKWVTHFKWDGKGPMSAEERSKLDKLVARTHQEGKRLRFWRIPDSPLAWGTLLDAGVDLINVDNLVAFKEFCLAYQQKGAGQKRTVTGK